MYHTELTEEQQEIIQRVLFDGEKEVKAERYNNQHSYHFGFDIMLTLLIALPEVPPETMFDLIGEKWLNEDDIPKRIEWQENIIQNIEKLKG